MLNARGRDGNSISTDESQEKPTLPFHEKFMAWLIISVLLFLTVLNIIFDEPSMPMTESEHHLANPLLEIVIEGAVEFPGVYQVKKGSLIKEVLELAKPLPEANLKRIKLDSPITRRRVIKISKLVNAEPQKRKNREAVKK